jgi:hypothetical protein
MLYVERSLELVAGRGGREVETPDHRRVYGVDFSGARDAGKRIWLAGGMADGDVLRIDECVQAKDLPGSAANRDECLAALRAFIAGSGACAFGLDFPFGLPRALLKQQTWQDFVLAFPDEHPDAEAFRESCRQAAGGCELKRLTDREGKTPFSAYNLRLFRQTYYGIRDLLQPLVREGSACVRPMQRVEPDKPWILEICPASTLKREGLYLPGYKNREGGYSARVRILDGLEATGSLSVSSPDLRSMILNEPRGDALDSVVAAFATWRALRDDADYALEGFVYV